jgi:hypothetical protein
MPSARNLHKNPQILSGAGKPVANQAGIVRPMGNIIRIQFRQSRLPRRLLRDGWWLQSPPVRPDLEVAHHGLTPAARVPEFGAEQGPEIRRRAASEHGARNVIWLTIPTRL